MTDYEHARDIPDETFLAAVRTCTALRNSNTGATRWDVASVLGGLTEQVARLADGLYEGYVYDVPGVPKKVVLAKAQRLIDRRLLDGCTCGCRGDFEPVDQEST